MSFLQNFSKILIFKNSPDSKFYFELENGAQKVFNQTYPLPNIANANVPWIDLNKPNFIQDNLLHAMGVEESQALGYNKAPASFGQAYLDGDEIILRNDGFVSLVGNLPSASANTGDTYVVTTGGGVKYYSDGTTWINKGTYDFIGALSPVLVPGDYIFYGPPDASDPNDLSIAGKVKEVLTTAVGTNSSTTRIVLEKDSGVNNDLVDLYYYRKSWNGKNIPVDISNGFYILIGIEVGGNNGRRIVYPWLDPLAPTNTSSDNQIVNTASPNKTAFTDLIRIRRISKKYVSDVTKTVAEASELIPCTIVRTNTFQLSNTVSNSYFNTTDDFPHWCAYFVNPYGSSSTILDKSSVYVIEINEMLPAATSNDSANDTGFYTAVKIGVV